MTTKLVFTFKNAEELSAFTSLFGAAFDKEPASTAKPTTPSPAVLPPKATLTSMPEIDTQPVKVGAADDDMTDFEAFRRSITQLLAQSQKSNAFFKDFLATKGYGKLSDVPEAERQHFVQDFSSAIKNDEVSNDGADLPF